MQDLTEDELEELERSLPEQSASPKEFTLTFHGPALTMPHRLVAEVRRLRAAMEPAKDSRLYAQRDSESLGAHYFRHVEAMTAEGLHDKSAIAAELAWRDVQITELRGQLADEQRLRKEYGF